MRAVAEAVAHPVGEPVAVPALQVLAVAPERQPHAPEVLQQREWIVDQQARGVFGDHHVRVREFAQAGLPDRAARGVLVRQVAIADAVRPAVVELDASRPGAGLLLAIAQPQFDAVCRESRVQPFEEWQPVVRQDPLHDGDRRHARER